jgi:hypothetical protein
LPIEKEPIMAKTEVVVKENTAVAIADDVYSQDAGSGFEETSQESYAIPFLSILQSGSPQVKKSDGAYIKGAEEGMLFNSVTQECYGEEGVEVIPCHYTQRFIEWGTRESGGGFFGEHLPSDPICSTTTRDEKGRNLLPNGHALNDTRNHYVLIRRNGQLSPAIMSLSSTQIKASKQWMSMMQGIKQKNPATGMFEIAPMFSHAYKINTVAQSNDKGSWFGYKFTMVGKVTDTAEYEEAKSFNHIVKSGLAKVERKMETEAASNEAKEKF